jgi:hypothetical protein
MPDAETVVLVMDNLKTHDVASLYEAFDPFHRGASEKAGAGPGQEAFTWTRAFSLSSTGLPEQL